MSETLSEMVASLTDPAGERGNPPFARGDVSLDELAAMTRIRLLEEGLEAGEAGQFIRDLVDAYVGRFQSYPFDVFELLFGYLELRQYPEGEMRDLAQRLEARYTERRGASLRMPAQQTVGCAEDRPKLDDEISQLRETLKYAAIAGERLDD